MRLSFRKICPWLVGILLLLWIYIAFYSKAGYQETLIPYGTESFTASFSRVSEIIPINENVASYDLVETSPVSMTIQFTDLADGTVQQVNIVDSMIHTNGYANKDNVHADGLPLTLEVGHIYAVQYWAVCDGQTLENLSIALYGGKVSYRWLQAVLIITLLICGIGLFGVIRNAGNRQMILAALVLWVSIYVLYLLSMPLQMREEESCAFGRAYAVSNEIMGMDASDENGYVFVDDIGLRNNSYLVYDVPYYRFWSHIDANADMSRAATVTYQDDGVRTPRTYIDAAMITIARKMGLSYPLVYLAVAIGCGILGALALGVILYGVKSASIRVRVTCISLLPSIISILQLHSGIAGLVRPFESDLLWLQMDEILHRIILYVSPSDGTSYLITFVPLLVLGLIGWKDVHHQALPEQTEKTLLSAMTVATVASALLRFAI